MRVSVVVPAFNAGRYLAQTIESVLAQGLESWELVIVNDGSSDDTERIACSYAAQDPRIRVLPRENGGVAAARNTGYLASCPESEFICYLDNDDIWEPDALQTLLHAIESHPGAVAAHGLPRAIDEHGDRVRLGELELHCRGRRAVQGRRIVDWPIDRPTVFACLADYNYIISPGLAMIRRSAHEKAGLWDECLSGYDDLDLWMRLCRFGDIAFVDRVVLNYRVHGSNLSTRKDLMKRSERALLRKLLAGAAQTPEQRDQVVWGYKLHARASMEYRLTWAREALRSGKLAAALHQFRHAAYEYSRYALGPRWL
jgi:glycosyltransferase involved in cell wall biosynthesis